MTDLKPCPCCGGTAQLHRVGLYHGIGYRVSCDECLMRTDDAFEPMTAIDTWNNRIPTPRKCCGRMTYVQKMNQKLFEQLDAMEKDMDEALKYMDKLNKKLDKRLKELDW